MVHLEFLLQILAREDLFVRIGQYLDELVAEALAYWDRIPPEQRDFDRAKAEFLSRSDSWG